MATSGSVITNKVDENTYFYVNWQQASQSVSGNYTDINWQHGVNCRYNYGYNALQSYGVGINGQTVYGGAVYSNLGQGTHQLASGTLRIYHDANGNKRFNVNTSGWVINEGTVSGSQNFDLNKINRVAITNSVTGSDIEQPFSVNYTKYVNNYTYKLRVSIPNVVQLDLFEYNTSNTPFTLSQSVIEELYSRFTTTNTFNLGFRVETWNGNTKLSDGNEKIISCKITGATPIFNDFDFNDINPTTLALTGNSKYNVNGYSTIRVLISQANKAVAQKGASMSKYQLIVGSTPKEVAYSDDSDVYIDLPNSSIGEYKLYAVDSRGNSTLVTKLAQQTIDYTPLNINRSNSYVERNNGGIGEEVNLNYDGNIWVGSFGDVNNSIVLARYEYKATDSSNWIDYDDFIHAGITPTNITPTITSGLLNFNGLIRSIENDTLFDVNKSFNFRITLQDKLSTTIVELTPLPSGIPNISLNKNGVGIMCDYDEQLGGLLQVGGEVYNSNKVVAEYEVTGTNENSLVLNNLELKKDKTYCFKIVGSATVNTDLHVRMNDISSHYYSFGTYKDLNATASTEATLNSGYRPNTAQFYYSFHMKQYYTIIEGKIMIYKNLQQDKYYPSMTWRTYTLWAGSQQMGDVFGVLGENIEQINKMTFTTASGYFRKGTKIQIIEENKFTIM